MFQTFRLLPRLPGVRVTRRWRGLLFAAILAVTLAMPTAGNAAAPVRSAFDDSFTEVDSTYCAAYGITFEVAGHIYGVTTIFTDGAGNFVRGTVHINADFTFTSGDQTLVERDTWTIFFNPDGSREVGLFGHVQGAGKGVVLRDAGQLVFDSQGTFLYMRGPHESFDGATWCPGLLPKA